MKREKIKFLLPPAIILVLGEIYLIFNLVSQQTSWLDLILFPIGATAGYFLLDLNWFRFPPKIKTALPLILLPLTLFILTSTLGILGKSLIIFLNLKLFLDKLAKSSNNENQLK